MFIVTSQLHRGRGRHASASPLGCNRSTSNSITLPSVESIDAPGGKRSAGPGTAACPKGGQQRRAHVRRPRPDLWASPCVTVRVPGGKCNLGPGGCIVTACGTLAVCIIPSWHAPARPCCSSPARGGHAERTVKKPCPAGCELYMTVEKVVHVHLRDRRGTEEGHLRD